jgi:putative colanic acid biosynthesis UDP-glucose lipid carrier transferase
VFVAVAPFMFLIAMLIRAETPGPAIFRQTRCGLNGKRFTIFKFRTMAVGPSSDGRQATHHDPRVTRFGRFLRHSSLDELPQLFNVLRGEMSFVGPRPHPVWLDEKYASKILGYKRRYMTKPGITGLAQVHGCRGETSTDDLMVRRVRYDLEYADKISLRTDFEILLRTAICIWFQKEVF